MLGIAIPYRPDGGKRDEIHEWNLERLESFGYARISVESDGRDSEHMNRSVARNRAVDSLFVKYPKVSNVLLLDSDTIFNPQTLVDGLRALSDGASWVIPFDKYYRTSKASGGAILKSPPDVNLVSERYTYTHIFTHPPTEFQTPESGVILVTREAWVRSGGYHEGFVGWGYEDRAWVKSADVILGPHVRLPGDIYHIWHLEPFATTWGNPYIDKNKGLASKMDDITDPDEMYRFVKESHNG
jgi:hypothetical protein